MTSFDWKKGLPTLELHSEVKHEILRKYVMKYIDILCQRTKQTGADRFPIYLVDGFAGGGIYKDNKPGSPLVLLQAVEEVEALINKGRHKKFNIDAYFFFIENKKSNYESLIEVLRENRYKHNIDKNIRLYHGSFNDYYHEIIKFVSHRHKRMGARVIFFLDPEGYTQIKPSEIANIMHSIPNAEFLLYIAIEWFLDFIRDDEKFKKTFKNLGLDPYLGMSADDMIKIKNEGADNWKYIIESQFANAWKIATKTRYFRPFFIEPVDNHRGYWLLHLSSHPAAHDAMTRIHWEEGNYVKYYGVGSGFNLFANKPNLSGELPGMAFNEHFERENIYQIQEDIMNILCKEDEISVEALIERNRNNKAATNEMVYEAIAALYKEKNVKILSKGGHAKKIKYEVDDENKTKKIKLSNQEDREMLLSQKIKLTDIIKLEKTLSLNFL